MVVCVFFFKQKTAYEMRISDWSSDVCSSDLIDGHLGEALIADAQKSISAHQLQHAAAVDGRVAAAELAAGNLEVAENIASIHANQAAAGDVQRALAAVALADADARDRKSTRLNSSHYCATRMPSAA